MAAENAPACRLPAAGDALHQHLIGVHALFRRGKQERMKNSEDGRAPTASLTKLPDDLPAPADDGACAHLPGKRLPNLSALPGKTVIYFYPMTGRPGIPLPAGWDAIPGARGCTPQSCSFRDHFDEIKALGARVFGVSAQDGDYQREAAQRLHLPFELVSDDGLHLAEALSLPLFEVDGKRLIRRLTLIAENGVIGKVFYPVFPPDRNAGDVIAWLSAQSPG